MALRLQAPTTGSRLAIVLTTVIVTTVVLVGGVALATVGINSVGSPQIKNGSIRSVDIANGQVKSADIANGTIGSADLRDNAVRGLDIRDGTIASADIADGTITGADIADGSVAAADLTPDLLRWAKVDADAAGADLLSGRGVTSVARIATGIYSVTFDGPVTGCGWIATVNDNADGVVGPGEIGIELGSSVDASVLWVRTWDSGGSAVDRSSSDGFTVQVVC